MGIETIVWTLYGSATGQCAVNYNLCSPPPLGGLTNLFHLGVLAMYNDMSEVPTFFYFLPLWAFM